MRSAKVSSRALWLQLLLDGGHARAVGTLALAAPGSRRQDLEVHAFAMLSGRQATCSLAYPMIPTTLCGFAWPASTSNSKDHTSSILITWLDTKVNGVNVFLEEAQSYGVAMSGTRQVRNIVPKVPGPLQFKEQQGRCLTTPRRRNSLLNRSPEW